MITVRASTLRIGLVVIAIALTSCAEKKASPLAPSGPVDPDPGGAPPLLLQWPVPGLNGVDWVINNYVDLDPSGGLRDYRGGTKTYDGHRGVDVDVPNFRWMDRNHPVEAAADGVVISLEDGHFDRNVSCSGPANFVNVRHADGSTMLYLHFKQNSIAVAMGQQVRAGDRLGVVGSSGCSTQPHLHFELHDPSGLVVDPFLERRWADPPVYDARLDFMDLVVSDGPISGVDELKDPRPNIAASSLGSTLGVGLSMAGGATGDVILVTLHDGAGQLVQEYRTVFQRPHRHSYWFWNRTLTGTPGRWVIRVYTNGAERTSYDLAVT